MRGASRTEELRQSRRSQALVLQIRNLVRHWRAQAAALVRRPKRKKKSVHGVRRSENDSIVIVALFRQLLFLACEMERATALPGDCNQKWKIGVMMDFGKDIEV